MVCVISLIDPTTNDVVKTYRTSTDTLKEVEEKKEQLNQALDKKANPKGKYWTVTHVNI